MTATPLQPHVAIASGGTGGHLYPGLAVGERLLEHGAAVTLVVSEREIDRQGVRGAAGFGVLALPAVGFSLRGGWAFLRGAWTAYRQARVAFANRPPAALLCMGGFTSAPPAAAARRLGVPVFLHEANAVPGRANRWLARQVRRGYVCFPEAVRRLRLREVEVVGMPVRRQFRPADAGACRMALGLDPARRVLLVMGGSQGARGVNEAIVQAAPALAAGVNGLQFLHLTGSADEGRVRAAYANAGIRAVVRAFLTEMELALGAADAAVARAGASSAAELAALRVPALLIPYPYAADNHQEANARALEAAGAARWLPQAEATAGRLAGEVSALLADANLRARLRAGWAAWHRPDADRVLADDILRLTTGAERFARTVPIERSPASAPTTA